jgi:hypothetical protein
MHSIKKYAITLAATLFFAAVVAQASERDATKTGAACGLVVVTTPPDSMTLDAAIQRIACQAATKRLLIVGEIHGTQETPAFVAALVKATSKNRPVRIGLEWPAWMLDYVSTYLAS